MIKVKEGVYEEYVTITRTMKNVTFLGDGSKKSIVTGKKSFADGITTFKTATFSKDDRRRRASSYRLTNSIN